MDNLIPANLWICDRCYPMRVNPDDEEKIKAAQKKINDTVGKYKPLYPNKDNQDYLAMVALQFATKVVESEEHYEVQPVIEELSKLDAKLSELLND